MLRIAPKDWRFLPKCYNFLISKNKIEDWHANFEDPTIIFEEVEDSIMRRDPQHWLESYYSPYRVDLWMENMSNTNHKMRVAYNNFVLELMKAIPTFPSIIFVSASMVAPESFIYTCSTIKNNHKFRIVCSWPSYKKSNSKNDYLCAYGSKTRVSECN